MWSLVQVKLCISENVWNWVSTWTMKNAAVMQWQLYHLGPVYMRWRGPVRLAGPLCPDLSQCLFSLIKSWFIYMRRKAGPLPEIPAWATKISTKQAEKFSYKPSSLANWAERHLCAQLHHANSPDQKECSLSIHWEIWQNFFQRGCLLMPKWKWEDCTPVLWQTDYSPLVPIHRKYFATTDQGNQVYAGTSACYDFSLIACIVRVFGENSFAFEVLWKVLQCYILIHQFSKSKLPRKAVKGTKHWWSGRHVYIHLLFSI